MRTRFKIIISFALAMLIFVCNGNNAFAAAKSSYKIMGKTKTFTIGKQTTAKMRDGSKAKIVPLSDGTYRIKKISPKTVLPQIGGSNDSCSSLEKNTLKNAGITGFSAEVLGSAYNSPELITIKSGAVKNCKKLSQITLVGNVHVSKGAFTGISKNIELIFAYGKLENGYGSPYTHPILEKNSIKANRATIKVSSVLMKSDEWPQIYAMIKQSGIKSFTILRW